MSPLRALTSVARNPLHLTDVQSAVVARMKETLANAAILAQPSPEAQFFLMVDASTVAAGATVKQGNFEDPHPLAFFPETLQQLNIDTALSGSNASHLI